MSQDELRQHPQLKHCFNSTVLETAQAASHACCHVGCACFQEYYMKQEAGRKLEGSQKHGNNVQGQQNTGDTRINS
jgi:hypothetical protein